MLIDVAISGDRNVIKKEAEKILKYKDLTIGIQRMWNVKTKVIPVIISATGSISKSFRKYVSNIPGNHDVNPLNAELNPICHLLALGAHHILHVGRIRVKELQKTAILGTAHILRKVLTQRFSYNGVKAGTSDMSTMNSNTRIAATWFSLGIWFVSGI
jgi:hypothetical protein